MHDKNYHIITYGCQMNQADSETIAGILSNRGFKTTDSIYQADLILLITCAVREHAEQRIYGKLGELMQLKNINPALVIGIGGCMPQQLEVANKLRQKFPRLDLIFGTHNLPEFETMLDRVFADREQVFEIHDIAGRITEDLPKSRIDRHKAYVNITFGCNNFCTYCIVPHVRGRERSRNPNDIINEVINLVQSGYQEVTLLGQNVNSYGLDLNRDFSFADLLKELAMLKGLSRIRFMTPHPKDISDRLIDLINKHDNICNHIHLPLQSGSSAVLRRMNRKYSKEGYLQLAQKIRDGIANCTITTDIIVGFPGESEADFADTIEVVNTVKFDAAFTFAYSKRKGTPAAGYSDQVPQMIKKQRLHRLIELVQQYMLASNQACLGQTFEVMVDGPSKKDPSILSGRTKTNKLVHFAGQYQAGDLVDLKIYRTTSFVLWGETI